MKLYAHILLILILVSASISPACQFMSGSSFAEICGTFSNKKVVIVDQDIQDYFASKKSDTQLKELPQISLNNCAFCFAQVNIDQIITEYFPLPTKGLNVKYNQEREKDLIQDKDYFRSIYPRGPPLNLA